MIAAENTAVIKEKIVSSPERHQRLQQFMQPAHKYITRVFLEEQKNLQASNKSCYLLSVEKRNKWQIKIKSEFEFK